MQTRFIPQIEAASIPGLSGQTWQNLKRKDVFFLLLLTLAGLLIHGYHPFSEDSETYLPGIEKMLHPELFPTGSEYFLLHSHLTFFPNLIATSVRLSHLPFAWALFVWHLLSIFLFLLACWCLMQRSFTSVRAQWCGLTTITVLLTLSVTGTALYIMDEFLNPRNLTAFAVVFSVVKVLDRKYLQAILFLLFSAAIHPFMTVFAASFAVLLAWMDRSEGLQASHGLEASGMVLTRSAALWLPFHLFELPSPAYESVSRSHRYQFLVRWRWYEFLGALAPLLILYWFSLLARARKMRNVEIMCKALIVYGSFYFVAGLIVSIPARLEVLSRLQPMRSLYLLYILFFLFAGGFAGEFVLKAKAWRWLAVFLPLSTAMYAEQRSLFPASAHVELPWREPRNPWAQAFLWTRDHTAENAVFALDPYYMNLPGEDEIGFRAVAQRSQLADGVKDSGVVEMFPQIGDQWLAQVKAQTGIEKFQEHDLERLQSRYGVSWVILRQPAGQGLVCPYQNQAVKVCRLH